jgi:hypothetical protein
MSCIGRFVNKKIRVPICKEIAAGADALVSSALKGAMVEVLAGVELAFAQVL